MGDRVWMRTFTGCLGGIGVAAALVLGVAMGGGAGNAFATDAKPGEAASARAIAYHAPGVTYDGLHTTQNPTAEQVAADLKRIKQHFGVIRTYYAGFGNNAVNVGEVAADVGLKVLLGLYLYNGEPDLVAKDYEQFVKPAVDRGNVIGILIGNEDSNLMPMIKEYLVKAKADFPQTPVGSSQTAGFWLSSPQASELLPLVDFIAVNIYPAWDWEKADAENQPIGVTPQAGFESFQRTYEQVAAKYPDKQVVVTETGWPTTYGKIPAKQYPIGISNAGQFLKSTMNWAETSDPKVNFYLYGMFDPLYGVGLGSLYNYHFGLVDSEGKAKGVFF